MSVSPLKGCPSLCDEGGERGMLLILKGCLFLARLMLAFMRESGAHSNYEY